MSRVVRAALTQTRNAYEPMPETVDRLHELAPHLEDVRAKNVEHNVDLLVAAAAAGARVACLGELFPAPYFALTQDELWHALAEDAYEGPTAARLRQVAREHELVLVAPLYELARDGRRFNTAVVIDADGEVRGTYRKTHIPCGTNERATFSETFYYDPSDGRMDPPGDHPFFPVFDTAVGRIGVATCYDRHFEGVMSGLKAGGAEIVFSPAVTFGAQSERMWELEFAVDAARHRLYIGGSNRLGSEPPWNVEYFGRSHFIGPEGPPPKVAAPRPELVLADLDLDRLRDPQSSGWDLVRDARPETYRTGGDAC